MLHEVLLIVKIPFFNVKTNFFKNSFFPAVITEWNNSSCHIFKNLIMKFIRPEPNRISSTQNFEGLQLLARMRLIASRYQVIVLVCNHFSLYFIFTKYLCQFVQCIFVKSIEKKHIFYRTPLGDCFLIQSAKLQWQLEYIILL